MWLIEFTILLIIFSVMPREDKKYDKYKPGLGESTSCGSKNRKGRFADFSPLLAKLKRET